MASSISPSDPREEYPEVTLPVAEDDVHAAVEMRSFMQPDGSFTADELVLRILGYEPSAGGNKRKDWS